MCGGVSRTVVNTREPSSGAGQTSTLSHTFWREGLRSLCLQFLDGGDGFAGLRDEPSQALRLMDAAGGAQLP